MDQQIPAGPNPNSAGPSGWRYAVALGLAVTMAQLAFVAGVCGAAQGKSPIEAYASLYQWDSFWYGSIIVHGYYCTSPLAAPAPKLDDDGEEPPCNVAFFPGYPLLARGMREILGEGVEGEGTFMAAPEGTNKRPPLRLLLAALLTAQLSCWGFWTYAVRFLQQWQTPTGVLLVAVLAIALYPAAFFLVSAYSESLFLATMLGFFYWSERRGPVAWVLSALHGFGMTATRLVGLPLIFYPVLARIRPGGATGRATIAELCRKAAPALLLAGVAALGGLLFFLFCQVRFGHWNLYLEMQENGWGVRPDYLGLFKPKNLSLYTPFWRTDSIGAHGVSRVSVAWLLLVLLGVAALEWRLRKTCPASGLAERLGFYLAGAALFYVPVAGLIGDEQVPLRSMVRYGLCVHVVIVMALVHMALRVPPLTGVLRSAALYGLAGCLALFLALQVWLVWLFTNRGWAG